MQQGKRGGVQTRGREGIGQLRALLG